MIKVGILELGISIENKDVFLNFIISQLEFQENEVKPFLLNAVKWMDSITDIHHEEENIQIWVSKLQ